MDRMFTDTGFEVTEIIKKGRTIFVLTREEAIKLTEKAGYYYTMLNYEKSVIGFGIPK